MDDILKDLNKRFDHTNLRQDALEEDIIRLCREALEHNLYSVVVNPCFVPFAKDLVMSTKVKLVTVCGFPLGTSMTSVKIKEAVDSVSQGADETDMVTNIGDLKTGRFDKVENEIISLRKNIPYNTVLKVIIETGRLSDDEITNATKAVINSGADFVKTSTGFFELPTIEQVKLMSQTAQGKIEVKAAGGIRSLNDCLNYLNAGATRLGCSSSVTIINEWKKKS